MALRKYVTIVGNHAGVVANVVMENQRFLLAETKLSLVLVEKKRESVKDLIESKQIQEYPRSLKSFLISQF